MINLNWNKSFAVEREGSVKEGSRHILYQCPANKTTIGYGYNLEDNGIDEATAQYLLNKCLVDVLVMLESNVSYFDDLDEVRKSVLTDMCFNMGWPTLSRFKNMFAAIESGNYEEAANQMVDSAWYRQVGVRSKILVEMMRSSAYP